MHAPLIRLTIMPPSSISSSSDHPISSSHLILPKMLFLDSHVSYPLFSQSYPRFPRIPKSYIHFNCQNDDITESLWLSSMAVLVCNFLVHECACLRKRYSLSRGLHTVGYTLLDCKLLQAHAFSTSIMFISL